MVSDMTLTDRGTIPMLSAQSLFRPLVADEVLDLWGSRLSSIPDATLNELESILQEGDEQDREIVEACIQVAIYNAMQARILSPRGGHLYRLSDGLREAVDRFNRYIR